MLWGETNKHAKTSTAVPLWNAFAILQVGIKDIDGTAEDVSSTKVRMIRTSAAPKFFRGETTKSVTRNPIVDPDGIVDDKGPEADFAIGRPVQHEMDEICTSKTTDSTDGAFSDAILVMGTDSTEVKRLILTDAMVFELSTGKDTIVRVITFDFKSKNVGFGFNNLLSTNGSCGREILLWKVEDLSTSMIDIEGSTDKAMVGSVLSKTREQTATGGGHKVIARNTVSWMKMISFESHCRWLSR